MTALVTCKSGEDSLKIKAVEWSQHFPITGLWGFFQTVKGSYIHSPWSNMVEFQDFMTVHVTYKNEEDHIKKGPIAITALYIIFFQILQGRLHRTQ